jgi:hypothetical protein
MLLVAVRRHVTMITIIFCLAHLLVPELRDLCAALEVQSALLAVAIFCGLAGKLWSKARPQQANSGNVNLLAL